MATSKKKQEDQLDEQEQQEAVKPNPRKPYEKWPVKYDNGEPKKKAMEYESICHMEDWAAEELNKQWVNSGYYYFPVND